MCYYCNWWILLRYLFPKEVVQLIMENLFQIVPLFYVGNYVLIGNHNNIYSRVDDQDKKIRLVIEKEDLKYFDKYFIEYNWMSGIFTLRQLRRHIKDYIQKEKEKELFKLVFIKF